jgi:RNA polymerase sigma factor (sigma-70 family)
MNPEDLGKQHSWLKRKARRLMGSRLRGWVESGDLAQQAQQEAFRSLDGKSFANLAAFRGWLLKILRHIAIGESRRRGVDLIEEGWSRIPGEERTPSRVAAISDSGRFVRDRLRILPERERQVVLARVVDGERFAAIGERLGIAEGHARVIFHRSLEKLRTRDEFGESS